MQQEDGTGARKSLRQWWLSLPVWRRRLVRTTGALTVVTVLSLLLGLGTAKATSPLGPHEAQWRATFSSTATLDLGPLGSISQASPASPLGVDVVLKEVPSQVGVPSLEQASLAQLLSGDAASYGTLLSHPEHAVRAGVLALADDALRRAGVVWVVLLCLIGAGRLLTRGHLRDSVKRALTQPAPLVLLGTTALLAGSALLVPALRTSPGHGQQLAVLAGTPLEQARLSGRVADIVQAYGGQVRSRLEENKEFYQQAQDSLRAAWQQAETQPRPAALSGRHTTAVLSTDLHCNLDVIAFTGVLDAVAGADIHLDDGDLTMNGSSPENVCADALNRAVPAGVARAFSVGNHDSSATARHLRSLGWTVTDGTVQKVGGLRVLGDADPTRTSATGTTQIGPEDAPALGARLAETSCHPGAEVDLVLVHQPYTFEPLVRQGCAPLLLAGHVHREDGLSATVSARSRTGTVAQLVSGAGKGGTSLGPVTQDAFLHVLSFGPDGSLLAWRTVTLHPDATVTVSPWQEPPTRAQAAPQPTATASPSGATGPTAASSTPTAQADDGR